MIRLILVDVDGTLFGPNGVPACAWEAAAAARARGVHLAVCTGRPGRGRALEYARRLDPEGLHIFESGAAILHGDGRVVRREALPLPAYHRLVDLARTYALPLEAYTADGRYAYERAAEAIRVHERMLGFSGERTDLHALAGRAAVVRAQWVTPRTQAWQAARREVARMAGIELHEATSPGMPGVVFASVTKSGVSKLAAARWVAAQYGLDLGQAAMVGDGWNDLELIQAAGLGIAMGGAPREVKAAADRVVGSVDECGLAEAIGLALAAEGIG